MSRRMENLAVWVIIAVGLVILCPAPTRSAEEQRGIPVINQSFAAKELVPGDVWKVYLKASDPDGKMKYIVATVTQPGVGSYPVSMTKIKEENENELSGYVYLNTSPIRLARFFNLTLTLTINIKDDKGRFSKEAVFPLSFVAKPSLEMLPEGVFKDQDLGPIMVTLRTDDSGGRRR